MRLLNIVKEVDEMKRYIYMYIYIYISIRIK